MENELKNILKDKALAFCIANVHDFESFEPEKKEWYIAKVARLLLDDANVLKEMFKDSLN